MPASADNRSPTTPDNSPRAPLSLSSTLVVSKNQVSSELGGEMVIMDIKHGVYHGMEGVAASIWKMLARPISVREICAGVMAEYDVEAARCESDVLTLMGELVEKGLVCLVEPPAL